LYTGIEFVPHIEESQLLLGNPTGNAAQEKSSYTVLPLVRHTKMSILERKAELFLLNLAAQRVTSQFQKAEL
jgi:hypothetical protein